MNCEIILRLPSLNPVRFVEYKRPFLVEGIIKADKTLPDDATLLINLKDENENIIRHVYAPHKYSKMDLNNKLLKGYQNLDKDKSILNKYGFSAIVVNDDESGIDSAVNKCWFSDNRFEAIITSASDKNHGSIFDFGFGFKDENGDSYPLLEKGIYYLEIILKGSNLNCFLKKKIEIGKRDNQIICRFNPSSHKNRMLDWCKENNFTIIKDTLPGYLESYMGKWYYHMGILKMYHASDVCMYDDVAVNMFNYLMDETSTSYSVELGFINSRGLIEDNKMMRVFHYDIGEAFIKNRKAKVLKFKEDEYLYICRIDLLKENQKDNIYYLDQRNVKESLFDEYCVKTNEYFAIMGIVRPMQLNKDEVLFQEETNTYKYLNCPKYIKYTIISDKKHTFIKEMNLERIDDESIGKSVFEFYNVFKFSDKYQGKTIKINIECLDSKKNNTKASNRIYLNIV